jgi:putative heme-binding domain-containing protein
MTRRLLVALCGLAALAFLSPWSWQAQAQAAPALQWIWFDEGNPLQDAPAETRFFRRTFTLEKAAGKTPDEAVLEITADNAYTVWVNGVEVGTGNDWAFVQSYDVEKALVAGKNVLAVQARNEGGPAGLLVRLRYGVKGKPKQTLVSDANWKAAKAAGKGWEKADFDDSKWKPALALVEHGGGPWGNSAPGGARPPAQRRFTVPEGFRIEQAVENPNPTDTFSLVNMTFDARGRLLVSREGGPILVCTDPDDKGVCRAVRPYCTQVTNCQGMCWVKDSLFLVGNGPQGTGLYRCRDTTGADRIDDVKLLHRFNGGMGEHGPHAVVCGPDGFLYVVIGNHAWARLGKGAAPNPEHLAANSPLLRWPTGGMGPDQGKPGSTEDVLLPRLNDANGHAANILAPGGTIWRMDLDGRNVALVAAGFRNEFDAAFNPDGELFTFDSDMEWDEGLPWYRAVRVCHCPPGADFVWRTGAANTPNYYLDSLPPLYETGRGSPVGLEFYDHHAYPAKYQGAYFMADWSLGIVYAVHLKRDGATYRGEVEKFCTGSPMNVTDLGVGPDGALYLTLGGRGTQGGVWRIVYENTKELTPPGKELIDVPQPLAAWSRANWVEKLAAPGAADGLRAIAEDTAQPAARRVKALTMLHHSPGGVPRTRLKLLADPSAEVRAQAAWGLGIEPLPDDWNALMRTLGDEDAFVRRRVCETLVRREIEPPVKALAPLLNDKDRFLRTAARLVLQRIDPKKWAETLLKEDKIPLAWEAVVALCKIDRAAAYGDAVWSCLRRQPPAEGQPLLDYLRTVQLALLHAGTPPKECETIARACDSLFPHRDARVNRELAILLTHFRRTGVLDTPVHARLLQAIEDSAGDRQQQIHYFYCLRLLHDGWTAEQKAELLAWYDGTRSWSGGHSFSGFLENILRDAAPIFRADDAARLLAQAERYPQAALVLLRVLPAAQEPPPAALSTLYGRLAKAPPSKPITDLKMGIIAALGKKTSPEARAALRRIADADPAQREAVARSLVSSPTPENFPYLVYGLNSPSKLVLFDVIEALKKDPAKPKADDAAPYRALLLAAGRLDPGTRWKAVELLRHWSDNRQFGAEAGEWKPELAAWSRWFHQAFPKEPPLPNVAADKPVESKYKFDELLAFLQGPAGRGDAVRGRAVFEKAQCLKCHKYGKEGEAVGPDLTTLSKRFKRADVLESIYYPSKVISDQYRSTLIVTRKGRQFNGLAAVQGDTVTVLLSDGTKAALKKDQIEQQFASLVSVMPERLLDALTREEIADLFAFLESEPAK